MKIPAASARECQRDRDECPREALPARQDRARSPVGLAMPPGTSPPSSHAARKEILAGLARGSAAALRIDETAPPLRVRPGPPARSEQQRCRERRDVDPP